MSHRLVRRVRAVPLLVLGAVFGGCDADSAHSIHGALTTLGMEDPPALPPVAFQIVCDRSVGSPCDHGIAMQTIERIVHVAYERPLSRVEVFVMGEEVATTRLVASVTVPSRTERGERAARVAEERFLSSVRPVLCLPLDAELNRPRTRTSPIFESLDKVSLTRATTLPVELFAISDLREVSGVADFECGALPTTEQLAIRLRRRGLLALGTYQGTRLHFIVGDGGPVPRRGCPISMGRVRAIQSLFHAALTNAGAEEITFATEVPEVAAVLAARRASAPDAGLTTTSTTTTTTNPTGRTQ